MIEKPEEAEYTDSVLVRVDVLKAASEHALIQLLRDRSVGTLRQRPFQQNIQFGAATTVCLEPPFLVPLPQS